MLKLKGDSCFRAWRTDQRDLSWWKEYENAVHFETHEEYRLDRECLWLVLTEEHQMHYRIIEQNCSVSTKHLTLFQASICCNISYYLLDIILTAEEGDGSRTVNKPIFRPTRPKAHVYSRLAVEKGHREETSSAISDLKNVWVNYWRSSVVADWELCFVCKILQSKSDCCWRRQYHCNDRDEAVHR